MRENNRQQRGATKKSGATSLQKTQPTQPRGPTRQALQKTVTGTGIKDAIVRLTEEAQVYATEVEQFESFVAGVLGGKASISHVMEKKAIVLESPVMFGAFVAEGPPDTEGGRDRRTWLFVDMLRPKVVLNVFGFYNLDQLGLSALAGTPFLIVYQGYREIGEKPDGSVQTAKQITIAVLDTTDVDPETPAAKAMERARQLAQGKELAEKSKPS